MVNAICEQRVVFPKGNQHKFLLEAKERSNLMWAQFADRVGIKNTTLHSYAFEQCSLPLPVFENICELLGENKNEVCLNYKAEIKFVYNPIGKPMLGISRTHLKKQSQTFYYFQQPLDTSKLIYSYCDNKRNLQFPTHLTPLLAEEMGIHCGDGFLSGNKYEYRLKGNKQDEREYYNNYIYPLYKNLFNISVNIKEYETTYGFELGSKALWQFKSKILGLTVGKKNSMHVPEIIKNKDPIVVSSFLRGLFDTDGCIHFKSQNGIKEYYPVVSVSMKSENFAKEIFSLLTRLQLHPKIYQKDDGCWLIPLNGYERLKAYCSLIGFSNPKHIKKLNDWKLRFPQLSH